MGCDGGTIPKRKELVKTKQKGEGKDKEAELAGKWKFCALSSTKLKAPIVSCDLGKLYNKDAVIQFLLDKDSFPADIATHIRNLRDIIEIKGTIKKVEDASSTSSSSEEGEDVTFTCPVVGLEMNGNYRFVYIRKCGCLMSEKALKEVKSDHCHGCSRVYDPECDIVILNGTEEEVKKLEEIMIENRLKQKSEKKGKKRKLTETDQVIKLKDGIKVPSDVQSTSTSSDGNKHEASSSSSTKSNDASLNKLNKNFTVANDPNASESFKSLFTTHSSAKNKPKGHWVSYNPMYF